MVQQPPEPLVSTTTDIGNFPHSTVTPGVFHMNQRSVPDTSVVIMAEKPLLTLAPLYCTRDPGSSPPSGVAHSQLVCNPCDHLDQDLSLHLLQKS
ncbi:hypothetical protein KC325_g273 [Hortaea werneckii]|nr:hypothetical protein KC325_g273 [Hortaea werneckii]